MATNTGTAYHGITRIHDAVRDAIRFSQPSLLSATIVHLSAIVPGFAGLPGAVDYSVPSHLK
jgi:hypothetical protein